MTEGDVDLVYYTCVSGIDTQTGDHERGLIDDVLCSTDLEIFKYQ